jgi:hypothetical protein
MNITVKYEETDVAKALEKIIKDSNSAEFVKLLTPMLCKSHRGVDWFFKLMIGNQLPEIISKGTLCKIKVDHLGYGANKAAIANKYADADDKVVVTIKEFNGFHDYINYTIDYINVDEHDNDVKDYTSAEAQHLEIIIEI